MTTYFLRCPDPDNYQYTAMIDLQFSSAQDLRDYLKRRHNFTAQEANRLMQEKSLKRGSEGYTCTTV